MKSKKIEFVIGIPDGPIQHMELSWAEWWINVWSNGGIGYHGCRMPTDEEKRDIRERLTKMKELLKKKETAIDKAMELMK